MKKPSYKKMTQALTGLTDKQYRSAYNKFAARVRNYNRIAGTSYDAAREFYYSYRYAGAESPALRAIQATPATRARAAGVSPLTGAAKARTEKLAREVFYQKWGGWFREAEEQAQTFGGASPAIAIKDLLKSGVITYAEADAEMRALAIDRSQRKEKDPAYRY